MKLITQYLLILLTFKLGFCEFTCSEPQIVKDAMVKALQYSDFDQLMSEKVEHTDEEKNPQIYTLKDKYTLYIFDKPSDEKIAMIEKAKKFTIKYKDDPFYSFTQVEDCFKENDQVFVFLDSFYTKNFENTSFDSLKSLNKEQRQSLFSKLLRTINAMGEMGITQKNFLLNYLITKNEVSTIDVNLLFDLDDLPVEIEPRNIFFAPELKNGNKMDLKGIFFFYMLFSLNMEMLLNGVDDNFDMEQFQDGITDERLDKVTKEIIKIFDKVYTYEKPGVFTRFGNWLKSFFSSNTSTIYNFPDLIKNMFSHNPKNRKNNQNLMNSLNNCYNYSRVISKKEEDKGENFETPNKIIL